MTSGRFAVILSLCSLLLGSTSAQAATCSGSSCSGQNPFLTGCANDAYVAASSYALDSYGSRLGTTSLKWSPTCQAGYSQVQLDPSYTSAAFISATIHAGFPQVYDSRSGYTTHSTSAVSPLLSATLSQLFACGYIRIPAHSIVDADGAETGQLEGEGCAR